MTSFFRIITILQLIPVYPRYIEVETLREQLRERGIRITGRSLQRMLPVLAGRLPLKCDETRRPYYWSWSRNAATGGWAMLPAIMTAANPAPTRTSEPETSAC
jgi:hypothetical protein